MKEENKDISNDNLNPSDVEDEILEENNNKTVDEETDDSALLTEENAKLNDLLLRSRAELDNVQKRTVKQIQQAQLYSIEKFSSELLVIMDSLEAAEKLSSEPNLKVENLIEGNSLLLKTTKEVFEKLNIEEINPIDKDFDPIRKRKTYPTLESILERFRLAPDQTCKNQHFRWKTCGRRGPLTLQSVPAPWAGVL